MRHRPTPRRRPIAAAAPALLGILAVGLPFFVEPGRAKVPPVTSDAPQAALQDLPAPAASVAEVAVPTAAEAPDAPLAGPQPSPEPLEAPAQATPDPCADALAWVGASGLALPAGVGYHCPSTEFAHHGAACWNAWPCRAGAFIAINTDLFVGRGTAYLRHVVAHEVCHILDWQTVGATTEAAADACAAAHGAPA